MPNVEGVKQAIKFGLENAKINAEDVDLISAHATATKMGDVIEAQAIHSFYEDKPLVVGLKGYMGHTMSACGAIETVLSLYMLEEGFVAPTLKLEEVDERCSMIRHSMKFEESNAKIASIQNFAFGGVNTILFIKKWE